MSRLDRLIEYVINEVQHETKKHQTVDVALRQISIMVFGLEGSSPAVKKINKTLSEEARSFLVECKTFKEFHNGTINEHQMPLKEVWKYLQQHKNELTVDYVKQLMLQHPLVTVTKAEDARLPKSTWTPDRYSKVGIKVVSLINNPIDFFK